MKKLGNYAAMIIALGLVVATSVHAGTISLTVSQAGGKADFRAIPKYVAVPYSLRQRLAGLKSSAAVSILYSDGTVKRVSIIRSSGSALLDSAILRNIKDRYWVKSGFSGSATQSVEIAF
ncbi:MAG TPA: hypothetical protein VIT91_15335 [Chthoniobacterales bacterium]